MLDALLISIMAALAQRLKRTGPKRLDITVVGLNVIANELRCIALDPSAPGSPAGVEIAQKDR
jgi:hypothetical protein